MGISISQLEKLKAEGKIRGFTVPAKVVKKIKGLKKDKGSKNKAWIDLNLKYYAEANKLILVREFTFHPNRKFRFDWALTCVDRTIKIGVEYNGIFSEKSRHTNVVGYSRDREKVNLATAAGWQVIEVTPLNFKSVFTYIEKIINHN